MSKSISFPINTHGITCVKFWTHSFWQRIHSWWLVQMFLMWVWRMPSIGARRWWLLMKLYYFFIIVFDEVVTFLDSVCVYSAFGNSETESAFRDVDLLVLGFLGLWCVPRGVKKVLFILAQWLFLFVFHFQPSLLQFLSVFHKFWCFSLFPW